MSYPQFPELPSVKYEDGNAIIIAEGEKAEFLKRKIEGGYLGSRTVELRKKAYEPTEEERSRLSGIIEDLEGVKFYEAVAAQTLLDRQDDVLTKEFLELMAERYTEGRGIVDGHHWDYRIGHTFSAMVQPIEGDLSNHELVVRFYVPEGMKMKSGNDAQTELDQGIVRRVSVSFSAPFSRFMDEDDPENTLGRYHWVYDVPRDPSSVEVFELSTVLMGAQQNARMLSQNGRVPKQITLLPQSEIDSSDMELIELKVNDKTLKVHPDNKTFIEGLVQEVKTLTEEKEGIQKELKVFQDAEEETKKGLIDQVVNLRSKVFGVEDLEQESKKFQGFSIADLEAEIKTLGSAKIKNLKPDTGDEGTGDEGTGDVWARFK